MGVAMFLAAVLQSINAQESIIALTSLESQCGA